MVKARLILQTGALVVFLHNLLFISSFGINSILNFIFYLDLIGFFLLGIGYIVWSFQEENRNNKTPLRITGVMIILWLVLRVYWQFFLTKGSLLSFNEGSDPVKLFESNIQAMMYFFILSGIVLLIGSYYAWRSFRGRGTFLFFGFGIINLVGILMITLPSLSGSLSQSLDVFIMGGFIKLFILPIIGIITYLFLFLQFKLLKNTKFKAGNSSPP